MKYLASIDATHFKEKEARRMSTASWETFAAETMG
jgi:hypothetical protein